VKFSPIGRPQVFLLNDLLFADAPPVSGDKVVVQTEAGNRRRFGCADAVGGDGTAAAAGTFP
jgi:hypothetical protein